MLGIKGWRAIALKQGIVAIPNERTLHTGAIPRGGGVVIAAVWLTLLAAFFLDGRVAHGDFVALFVGGAVMAVLGAVDDVVELDALPKFLVQVTVVGWGLYWIGGVPSAIFDLGWIGTL